MPRVTFDLPDDLHRELSAAVRKHKVNLGIAAVQALRLWLKTPPESIARMSGLSAGLSTSADRKRLEKYAELLRVGKSDVKALAGRRIGRLLAFAQEDDLTIKRGPPR
jgi:hypothetical protein